MARSDFGGTPGDTVWGVRPDDTAYLVAATITCWSAQTGGTQYTDLLLSGAAVTSIPVGDDSQIPVFQGPDGVTSLWISANGGPRAILRAAGSGTGTVTKASLGLGNVDNTSDVNKPVSTAQQAAIDNVTFGIADLPAGSVLAVQKSGGVWPVRPTATPPPGIFVLWIGADPSPSIVTTGTAGMYNGDVRMVTP